MSEFLDEQSRYENGVIPHDLEIPLAVVALQRYLVGGEDGTTEAL